ncbi:hypothetical protein REPUB_Repub05bG0051300 [Reevesia pubescens]
MASSSAIKKACFYCKSQSDIFFTGWQLRNGCFAMLCHCCGSAYKDGRFCDTFHPEASGWRGCASCKKRIHCGCIMASHTYTILDFGGVKCAECAINEALAPHRCSETFWSPEAMQHARDSPGGLSIDSKKVITGINLGIDPIASPDSVVCNVSPNQIATPTNPGAVLQAQSPLAETGEESSVNSPNGTNQSHQKSGGKRRKNAHKQAQVQSRYSPKTSSEELKEICRVYPLTLSLFFCCLPYLLKDYLVVLLSKSSLLPLFAKELTASDADLRNGRLVLPKRCAEAYFPKISGQQGIFIVVQDTKGNDWELYYRYWSNTNGKMYVLEGLKDYIILMQWQAGDTVTFYKREADGKLVMGFKKYQAAKLDQKVWNPARMSLALASLYPLKNDIYPPKIRPIPEMQFDMKESPSMVVAFEL